MNIRINSKLLSLFIIFTCCKTVISAQDSKVQFLPKWSKGDVKNIKLTTKKIEIKSGKEAEEEETSEELKVKITEESPTDYTLTLFKKDPIYAAILSMEDESLKSKNKDTTMEIQFLINKSTGAVEVKNWQELKDRVDKITANLNKTMEESEDKSSNSFVKLLIMPITIGYRDKESINANLKKEIDFLFIPFEEPYSTSDTIIKNTQTSNPMNPNDSIGCITKTYLSQLSEETCSIAIDYDLDESGFLEMMKKFARDMAKSFGADEKSMDKKMNEMDDMKIVMQMAYQIDYNRKSTWVTKCIRSIDVTMDEKKKSRRSKTIVTAIVD